MKVSLESWVGEADALLQLQHFKISQPSIEISEVQTRLDDFYISLVGELFEGLRLGSLDSQSWSRLGNAFAQIASDGQESRYEKFGIDPNECLLYSATAFYFGGFPASALLTMRLRRPDAENSEEALACQDLMARNGDIRSGIIQKLLGSLRSGELAVIDEIVAESKEKTLIQKEIGAEEWVSARLLECLLEKFKTSNLRAVLPDGGSDFWSPLVSSFLDKKLPSWEFFPSQIEAISKGLLAREETFSLQMPTGAGKTSLCETLLYWHAKNDPEQVAVLLVPYRSLASELRSSLVKRLIELGILARCAYGGTVPSGNEEQDLASTRVLVATPEALSGLIGSDEAFYKRISLVICDEGHLLDGVGRGVSLELLLARFRARESGAPRFVFVSAIVPNIEEINAWLGGTDDTVVRSEYRPSIAEYSVLRKSGNFVSLVMHPQGPAGRTFAINEFLHRRDFQWIKPSTGQRNTYGFDSIKTRAVAAARKTLAMGAAAVFASNKRGNQGALGLAQELIDQLDHGLELPMPNSFAVKEQVDPVIDYLQREYGAEWIGKKTLEAGAILHHGDIPQETREVLESLLRQEAVRLAICTSTLAEGVNLPIRTLVLYSVRRRGIDGRPVNLRTRDIKNLVGRAGRPGITTRGLVICANSDDWPLVEKVANQDAGEAVHGALLDLVGQLKDYLVGSEIALSNEVLESFPELHNMVDGVDATLVDLAVIEGNQERLVQVAIQLVEHTFAVRQADNVLKTLLQQVFELRAQKVGSIAASGKLLWIKQTGARTRSIETVEQKLFPKFQDWETVQSSLSPEFIELVLDWAWEQVEFEQELRAAYKFNDVEDPSLARESFSNLVKAWLSGARFFEVAENANKKIDDLLAIHTRVLSFVLQTLVEQGIALLAKLLESQGKILAPEVIRFPEYLRFGIPNYSGCVLAAAGLRHRSASNLLGQMFTDQGLSTESAEVLAIFGLEEFEANQVAWADKLGPLVFERTVQDLKGISARL